MPICLTLALDLTSSVVVLLTLAPRNMELTAIVPVVPLESVASSVIVLGNWW